MLTFLYPLLSGLERSELRDNMLLLCRPLHSVSKAGQVISSSDFGFWEAPKINVGTFQAPADWNARESLGQDDRRASGVSGWV